MPDPDGAFVAKEPGQEIVLSEPLVLDKLKFAVEYRVPQSTLEETAVLDSFFDEVLGDLVLRLRGYVYAEKLAEQEMQVSFDRGVTFTYPASWWQHLKADWTEWVTRVCKGHRRLWRLGWHLTMRYDTAYETKRVSFTRSVRTQQFAVFPESPIRTPEKHRGPIVVRYEQTWLP